MSIFARPIQEFVCVLDQLGPIFSEYFTSRTYKYLYRRGQKPIEWMRSLYTK